MKMNGLQTAEYSQTLKTTCINRPPLSCSLIFFLSHFHILNLVVKVWIFSCFALQHIIGHFGRVQLI